MKALSSLQSLRDRFAASARMPLVFLGHGSPMNAIEDTAYSRGWTELGRQLPRPQAILVVSAHWVTSGTTLVDVSDLPSVIHDFYGFPKALYDQDYPASGAPGVAREVVSLLSSHKAQEDETWGLDHGSWTVLKFLFPKADVPVFQLSIDMTQDFEWHLEIGRTLSELRDRGVLILGSGNIVHNLHALRPAGPPPDFAQAFDTMFTDRLTERDFGALTDRKRMGSLLRQAHPTAEHYVPALTIAGASDDRDALSFLNDSFDLGSVSMRSFVFHT
ncbi:4,5-DOPA dioxygenase extradiol [Aliiroseovarius sp.]|uniref:4,5-DOPA-extradiol-dioxygenase n=1 Tax=Aliiroseovarius sp. TaxID=1872442 RepID=UPI00261401F0|nr:4,5-DOPA dioxygenase extradiol [Aliiroseovarius sp.]